MIGPDRAQHGTDADPFLEPDALLFRRACGINRLLHLDSSGIPVDADDGSLAVTHRNRPPATPLLQVTAQPWRQFPHLCSVVHGRIGPHLDSSSRTHCQLGEKVTEASVRAEIRSDPKSAVPLRRPPGAAVRTAAALTLPARGCALSVICRNVEGLCPIPRLHWEIQPPASPTADCPESLAARGQ